jgi:hypothetical protein
LQLLARPRPKKYNNTLFSKVTSLQGNTCAQVITNGSYVRVKPLESKKYCSQLLTEMEQDVGVPDELIADQAGETTGKNTEWMKEVRRLKIKMSWAEAGRKNQNTRQNAKLANLRSGGKEK